MQQFFHTRRSDAITIGSWKATDIFIKRCKCWIYHVAIYVTGIPVVLVTAMVLELTMSVITLFYVSILFNLNLFLQEKTLCFFIILTNVFDIDIVDIQLVVCLFVILERSIAFTYW